MYCIKIWMKIDTVYFDFEYEEPYEVMVVLSVKEERCYDILLLSEQSICLYVCNGS